MFDFFVLACFVVVCQGLVLPWGLVYVFGRERFYEGILFIVNLKLWAVSLAG
jgi:hypothetical protein